MAVDLVNLNPSVRCHVCEAISSPRVALVGKCGGVTCRRGSRVVRVFSILAPTGSDVQAGQPGDGVALLGAAVLVK